MTFLDSNYNHLFFSRITHIKSTRLLVFCLLFICFRYQSTAQSESDSTSLTREDSASIAEIFIPEYKQIDDEEILNIIDNMPVFGIYQDNYFITGIPINEAVTQHTADAKYQISFRHRVTKTVLPLNTALFLTYTQRSFWNVYEESLPFKDSNFNPGLAFSRHLITKGKLWGIANIGLEHESNGRDSIYSRSWNYLMGNVTYYLNGSISLTGKVWMGFLAEENQDLFGYKGIGQLTFNYHSKDDFLYVSATINPRKRGRVNTIVEVSIRPFESMNQYVFLQWYQGYAENLLNYNELTSKVRLGFCIKPTFRSFY